MEVKQTGAIDLSNMNMKKNNISSFNSPKKKISGICILVLIFLVLIVWFFITLSGKSKGSFIPSQGVTNTPGEPPRLKAPSKP